MDLKDYINIDGNIGFLNIKVIPNSRETNFVDVMGDGVLKVRLRSVPEKGKANKELIDYISKVFGVRKSCIKIMSGGTDKNKLVRIDF